MAGTVGGVPLTVRYDNARGEGDLADELGVEELDALESAVLLSLLCDARADDADGLPAGTSKRGYWGDAYDALIDASDPPGVLGSRLWVIRERGLVTESAARLSEQYAAEALAWLQKGRYVRALRIVGEASGEQLAVSVEVELRTGRRMPVRVPILGVAPEGIA